MGKATKILRTGNLESDRSAWLPLKIGIPEGLVTLKGPKFAYVGNFSFSVKMKPSQVEVALFFKRRFFVWGNSAGFSLTEVMVGGAVLAGVALAGARMFKDQRSAQKNINAEQMLNTFHSNLTRILHDANNCNATLRPWYGGTNSTPGAIWSDLVDIYRCTGCTTTGTNYTASLTTIPDAARTWWLGEGQWIDKTMSGAFTDNTSTRIWRLQSLDLYPPANGSGTGKIRVTYQLNPNFKPGGGKTVRRDVNINMRFTQGSPPQFRECASQLESSVNNLQADICSGMTQVSSTGSVLMTWDPDTQTCVPNQDVKACPAGTVVEGIRSDGTVHCRAVNEGMTGEDMLLVSPCAPGTTVKLEIVDGKLKTTCI